jgi:hypothetical protein
MRERPPATAAPPPAPDSARVPAPRVRVYEPPAVLWEQAFVALAQVSGDYNCRPGECEDMP